MSIYRIKWTNKISGESGYVMDISSKGKHFINTFYEDEAKVYKNKGLAAAAIKRLTEYGEAELNNFEII